MVASPILDQYGQPIRREVPTKDVLTGEIARPTISGVRNVLSGYPADGLTPGRVAAILREADAGDPLRYLELAEIVEERDLHYVGVLGTRKRSISQLPITVEAASDDARDVAIADMVRTWLLRDELQDETFDILDAIGKGISHTEIVWDTSEGQWQPKRLEWRDPRWFTFDLVDGRTPLLRTEAGNVPLPAYKFITASIRAKSGLPIRSGLARLACWGWMFKSFTLRDWAIFCQSYGQPIRLGKYEPGSTQPERDILFDAVANIAGDCAAIIPASMTVEFVEVKSAANSADLYLKRADWLDQQISKGVLGQTATTDAIAGGHAVGQEHRQVQEDIERADARALAAALNRDLIRPWVELEWGPQKAYPRLKIGREDQKDIKTTIEALKVLVPMGLRIQTSDAADMIGFADPDAGADILRTPAAPQPILPPTPPGPLPPPQVELPPALQAAFNDAASQGDAVDRAVEAMLGEEGWAPLVAPMIEGLEAQLAAAGSVEEATAILARRLATMDVSAMAERLARATFAARLAGETDQSLSDRA